MFDNHKKAFKEEAQRVEETKTEITITPVQVGWAQTKVLAIQPSQSELKEIIGDLAERFDTSYPKRKDNYNNDAPSRTINIWVTDIDNKVRPTLLNFNLTNTPKVASTGSKMYTILREGVSTRGPWSILGFQYFVQDQTVGDVREKSTAKGTYTETILAETRVGEDQYYNFLKTIIGFPTDSSFLTALKEEKLDFDTVFEGDYSGLHKLVEYLNTEDAEINKSINTLIGIFSAKIRDNGVARQSFLMIPDTWFRNMYNTLTRTNLETLKKLVKDRRLRDGKDISNEKYTFEALQEYSEELVNKNIPVDNEEVDDWDDI